LQLIVGIIMIPLGGLISFGAMSGDYIYPYWIIGGIVFIIRGATSLLRPKPALQQASLPRQPYAGQGQYAQQPPYSQPQPQLYAQPQYPVQSAPSEQVYFPRQTYEQ
jgi:hypothetical protein